MPLQLYDRGVRLLITPPADPSAGPPIPLLFNALPPLLGVPSVPQMAIEFSFSQTISPEPNAWMVTIRNASQSSRDSIAGKVKALRLWKPVAPVGLVDGVLVAGGQVVTTTVGGMAHLRLDAGYGGQLVPVLSGAAESVRGRWEGSTHVLEITGSDGGFNIHAAVPKKVFPAQTPAPAILAYLASTLQAVLAPTLGLALLAPFKLPGGATVKGDAVKGITDICDALQLSWWMESVAEQLTIFILREGETLPGVPQVVSPAKIPGAIQLHRAPEPVEGGGLEIVTDLAASIRLARPVLLASAAQQGPYRVESVEHRGANRGGVWTTRAKIRNPAFELGI